MPRARVFLPILLGLAGALAGAFAQASDLDRVAVGAREDLEHALDELAELRERIADERIPLARTIADLEERVAEKRRERERLERLRDNREGDLARLRDEVERGRDNLAYRRNLIDDYLEAFETRLHIAELPQYRDSLREVREAPAGIENVPGFDRRFDLLDRAVERVRANTGGRTFPGSALGADGTLQSGRFALVGPIAAFRADDNAATGLAVHRPDSLRPSLFPAPRRAREDLRAVFDTGQGAFPVDPTLGLATRREEARGTLWSYVRQGGPVMIPILLLAFTAFAVALYKWREIARMPHLPPGRLRQILEPLNRGQIDEAHRRAEKVRGPVGDMLVEAVAHAGEGKDLMEEVMYEKMLRVQPKLDRLMPLIALTAATAPLLGLLGTVTGMIQTFQLITLFGTGDAQTLSGGISEALVTTQFGLMVAVPALIVHALLSRKSKGVIANMEQTSVALINGLTRERNPDHA